MKDKILKIIDDMDLPFDMRIEEIEKLLMMEALEKNRWIKLKAAKVLKVTYRIFNYKYQKYNLDSFNPRKIKYS